MPPQNPVAELVEGNNDRFGEAPRFEQTADGTVGVEDYRVQTPDPIVALLAAGVPEIGQPNAFLNTLLCRKKNARYVGGDWCAVNVTYATEGAGGQITPEPFVGTSYSRIIPGTTTIQRRYDVRIETDFNTYKSPINGLRGTTVTVGTMTLEVTAFPQSFAAADLRTLIRLARRNSLNQDTVTAPPLLGTQISLAFDPGELKYVTFEMDREGGLLRIRHYMEMAEDFDFVWYEEDELGNAVTGFRSVVYPSEPFAGIF